MNPIDSSSLNATDQSFTREEVKSSTSRIFSLNLMKTLSILSVVSFHSLLLPVSSYAEHGRLLTAIFMPLRFCVPTLLTISFFLLAKSISGSSMPTKAILKKRYSRLLIPVMFWFLASAILKLINHNPISEVLRSMASGTIFTGSYYLIILLQLFIVAIYFAKTIDKCNLVILSLIGATQGLLYYVLLNSDSLGITSRSLDFLRSLDRPMILYWVFYMFLGFYIHKKWNLIQHFSASVSVSLKILILSLYSVLAIVEGFTSFDHWGGSIPPFDYISLSILASPIVFFLCFSSTQEISFPAKLHKSINYIARYSLGIFCINGIICQIGGAIGLKLFPSLSLSLFQVLSLKLLCWPLLFLVSLLFALCLGRVGLKSVVM